MENEKNQMEAKGRLRQFIRQTPESELAGFSLGELAKQLHCCERHVSRLFREEWGASFPSYVSEIRLKKACQLLLQGNLKIIDVALESGHGSLAHFNYVFKKRFHMTPTEWREEQTAGRRRPSRAKPLQLAAVFVWLLLSVVGIFRCFGAEGACGSTTNQPAPSAAGTNAAAAQATVKFKLDRYEVMGNTLLASNVISRVLGAVHQRGGGYGWIYRQTHQRHGRPATGVFPARLCHGESQLSHRRNPPTGWSFFR